jgi:hypothetical protein
MEEARSNKALAGQGDLLSYRLFQRFLKRVLADEKTKNAFALGADWSVGLRECFNTSAYQAHCLMEFGMDSKIAQVDDPHETWRHRMSSRWEAYLIALVIDTGRSLDQQTAFIDDVLLPWLDQMWRVELERILGWCKEVDDARLRVKKLDGANVQFATDIRSLTLETADSDQILLNWCLDHKAKLAATCERCFAQTGVIYDVRVSVNGKFKASAAACEKLLALKFASENARMLGKEALLDPTVQMSH